MNNSALLKSGINVSAISQVEQTAQTGKFLFHVENCSMRPRIMEGDTIVCHSWNHPYFDPDRVFLIVQKNGEKMIKHIVEYNQEQRYIMVAGEDSGVSRCPIDILAGVFKVSAVLKFGYL